MNDTLEIALGLLTLIAGIAAIVGMVVILWMIGAGSLVFADPGAAFGAGVLTFILGVISTGFGVALLADI